MEQEVGGPVEEGAEGVVARHERQRARRHQAHQVLQAPAAVVAEDPDLGVRDGGRGLRAPPDPLRGEAVAQEPQRRFVGTRSEIDAAERALERAAGEEEG